MEKSEKGSIHSDNEHGRFNVQTSNEQGAIPGDLVKEERQCDENVSPGKSKATQQKDGKQEECASSGQKGNDQNDQASLEQIEAEKYENFKSAVERQDDKVISQGKTEGIQGKEAKHNEVSGKQGGNTQNIQTSNKQQGDTEKRGNVESGEEIENDKKISDGKTQGTQEKDAKLKKEVVSSNKGENIHKVVDEAVDKAVTKEDDRYKHHHLGIFSAVLKGSKHDDDKDHE